MQLSNFEFIRNNICANLEKKVKHLISMPANLKIQRYVLYSNALKIAKISSIIWRDVGSIANPIRSLIVKIAWYRGTPITF